jgi:capsular exopolysaccharide synthesis family protein
MMQYLYDFMENQANANELLPAMFVVPTYQSQAKEHGETSRVSVSNMSLITAVDDYNSLIRMKMRGGADAQLEAELAVLRANIVTTVKNMLNTLQIAKQDLDNHFVSANQQRSDMPEHVKKYEEMIREKRLKEKLYLLVCEQREENAMLLSSTIMPIKIITQAQMNPIPVSPRYMSILLLLVVGLAFPLGVMIVYDIVNTRVSGNPKDLEKRLKISLAGVLAKSKGEEVVVRDGNNSIAAELFRTLRTNIRFMQPKDVKCPVVLVTSSMNGEGKSYVATNLAVSMALLGKKVALVGLDLRKPTLAKYLNLPSQGTMTNYLSDKAYTLEDVVVASSVKNLDVLPAGIVPPNPSELLQSDRLAVLFAELRERYDYVVVDSAPVALVSDTFLLSGIADMTVCVVRANHTTFDMIEFLNKIHEQERLPKMVAVLNGVDAKEVSYGY